MSDKEKAASEWAEGDGELWFAEISTYSEGHKHAVRQAFLAGAEWALKDLEEKVKSGEIIQSVEQFRWIYFPEMSAKKEEE